MNYLHKLILLITCPLFLVSSAQAADWPQFRGPGATAVSEETGLPTAWNVKDGTNVRWKAELPGRGVSCPVVAGGKVYVTSCTGYRQDRLHVVCLDAASGKKLWERQLWATGSTNCHPKTSMAAPTPAVEGGYVYALFATGDLACLDAGGNLLWYRSLVRDYPTITNQVGMAASPVAWKGLVFVPMENPGDQSFVAALDAKTGRNRWKQDRGRDMNYVTPLVLPRADGADVLFQSKGELTAYDAETGSQRWTFRDAALSIVSSPLPADGAVLAGGGEVVAVRPAPENGTAEALWKSARLRSGYTTPLVYRKRVYALVGNFLNSADLADGKPGEPLRLPGKGPYWASPVAADGKIYVLAEDGTALVIKPGAKPELLANNAMADEVVATPAVADGALFVRAGGNLYCLAEKK